MKFFSILAIIFTLNTIGFSQSAIEAFQKALNDTGVVVRPAPPSFGEMILNPNYFEDLKKISEEKKANLASRFSEITPLLPKEGYSQTLLAILILQEFGTDQQKVEAFQDLDLYGKALDDACRALATCEGNEGVKLLKKYAESQIPGIELEIQKSKSDSNRDEYTDESPPSLKYFLALKALQGAYHSDGPASVSVLRERLVNLYGDLMSDQYRDGIRKELAEASLWREKFLQEKNENLKRSSNANQQGNDSLVSNSNLQSPTSITKKWMWLGLSIGASLASLLSWIFIRRKRIQRNK